MKSPLEENFSRVLQLFNVGNASCFHGAHNPPILQFRPPLFTQPFICHLNQSNVSLMFSICLLFSIPELHLAGRHEISSRRRCAVTLSSRRPNSPGATSGLVSLTPTVWVAVETGGGGRWMVGLAAHWARGLAHLGLATHRPCAAAACSWQEGRARAGAAEAA